jgi:methionyl-tRNA formyltransferase
VDEGIDTGPILLQKEADIAPDDTTGSLYFNKLFPLGIEALAEALDLIKADIAPRIAQDEALATYEPPCDWRYARINWGKPVQETYNLIRGCDPQPGAYTLVGGKRLQTYTTKMYADDRSWRDVEPGQVMDVREHGILVAGNGGALLIQRVRPEGQEKLAAAEFAQREGIGAGDAL